MATYSNPHWLLCHIRNSFSSTDDTSMCETIMVSDDLPKYYLQNYQGNSTPPIISERRSLGDTNNLERMQQSLSESDPDCDPVLEQVDFVCYPGLDHSDEEDATGKSYEIKMYPEMSSHRFRSNTAQKLEKMAKARSNKANITCVNYNGEIVKPDRDDYFVRKTVSRPVKSLPPNEVKSKLSIELDKSPTQLQSKFLEYAKFDGTSQTAVATKCIVVFIGMLPEEKREQHCIKICVLSYAKIAEVIGLVCYKASLEFPDLPLKSVRDYDLYIFEDIDDCKDFPPLDHEKQCDKFGFKRLMLDEKRKFEGESSLDINAPSKSMTSDDDRAHLAAVALNSFNSSGVVSENFQSPQEKDDLNSSNNTNNAEGRVDDLEAIILSEEDVLEAPVYRSYSLCIIDKRYFRKDVTLGIAADRIEIDQQKSPRMWSKKRSLTYPMDAVAHCEIVRKGFVNSTFRVWLKTASGISSSSFSDKSSLTPTSPSAYSLFSSPFSFITSSAGTSSSSQPMRFKHYDFETSVPMAEQIFRKIICNLRTCNSDVRTQYLEIRKDKLNKNQTKKRAKL